MIQLIGNKGSLAIEYMVTNPDLLMGHGRLWIENQPLGYWDDLIYLRGYLGACLVDLAAKPALQHQYQDKAPLQLLKELEQDLGSWEDESNDRSEHAQPYLLTCGTLFDAYLVFAYRQNEEIGIILWRGQYDDEGSPFPSAGKVTRYEQLCGAPCGDS